MTIAPISLPGTARRYGSIPSSLLYARTIAANLAHKLLKQRKRSREQVAADYDGGEWSQQAAAQTWLKVPDLKSYADKAWNRQTAVAMMDGELWTVPAEDYYAFRRRKLIAILDLFALGADHITELGSGTGANLCLLATSDRWSRITGLELSPTGREVTQTIIDHFGLGDRVDVGAIDLLDPASPGFARIKGEVCFTHYCLEQLPNHTEQVFRALVAAGVRRAILLEPSYELLSPLSLRDQASRTYVLRQDYQRSIVACARKLELEGLIKVVATEQLDFVSSCRNPPTLVVFDVVGVG